MKKCMEEGQQLQLRLKKIIGQLTAVQTMLGEDVPCEDILVQMNASISGLRKVALMILEGHLRHCVREGIENGNADETIENFAEALENYTKIS